MKKLCPHHNIPLEQAIFSGVEVDYCSMCYGLWFEEEELRWAKDERDKNLVWFDVDLFKHPENFRIASGRKLCPVHRLPLYEVRYGDSSIRVDVCPLDRGVWLDRGEFKDIVEYLKEKSDSDVLYHYLAKLKEEVWEVFSGPELLSEELLDVLAVLKLFQYKFAAQHPRLTALFAAFPK
ncbi:zf-TFIIB domain-containing protein [Patescibacteria group bacterium]|nr:zf-TFIIB domain-containing protein [Patescibacteria group bacterium]